MDKFIILIILLIFILIVINYTEINIYYNDMIYLYKIMFEYSYIIEENKKYEDINKIKNEVSENIRVLIFTFDNRDNLEYLKLHNEQLESYSKKWKNINYEFINKCDKNTYWCKIYIMIDRLKSNKYDYVLWLDSDAIISNLNKNIQKIFELYDSDIFISYDHDYLYSDKFLNAGIFAVKNSPIGIQFLEECVNKFENSNCLNHKNKLRGLYSFTCYEQGIMNDLIYSKYKKNTTVLSSNIFHNTIICNDSNYVLHNYGVKIQDRSKEDIINDTEKKISSNIRTPEDVYNCFNKLINKNSDIYQ